MLNSLPVRKAYYSRLLLLTGRAGIPHVVQVRLGVAEAEEHLLAQLGR